MSDEPNNDAAPSHLPALDGVRGVAVMMIVLYHAVFEMTGGRVYEALNSLLGALWIGVDLFFVLSGFLITRILLATRDRPHYFRSFYARRTVRIFPLYYGVLVALFVVLPLAALALGGPLAKATHTADYQQLWGNQLWLWTYTHNFLQATGPSMLPGFGHCWSLAVEEQFYLVWPLVVWALGRRGLAGFCLALGIGAPILRAVMLHTGADPWAIYQLTYTRCDTLAWGALAAVIEARPPLHAAVLRAAPWVGGAAVAGALWAFSFAGQTARAIESMFEPQPQTFGYTCIAVGFAVLILTLAARPTGGPRLLAWLHSKALRRVGKYSYAIYVFHWPVERVIEGTGLTTPHETLLSILTRFALVFAASFALAWLSWHLWEKHWLRLKAWFPY